jgi:hypothetical protein
MSRSFGYWPKKRHQSLNGDARFEVSASIARRATFTEGQIGKTMWTALLQAIGSFAAGAVAWVVLEFFGRPLRKFYDLRGETVYLLAHTANVGARWKEIPDDTGSISGNVEALNISDEQIADLNDARKTLRDLASRFRAFAVNESYALRFVLWSGYDPMKASAGLFGLSNSMDTYGQSKAFQKKTIADALRIPDL